MTSPNSGKVFVIHGRNESARAAVFTFLRAIKLDPLEWSTLLQRAGAGAPSIQDILDKAFSEAGAVVAILTPDDLARLRTDLLKSHDPDVERSLKGQARPNVLFEMGLALAKHPDKTVLTSIGSVRPFSDISGRFIAHLDNSVDSRQRFANLLKGCGCKVDLSGGDWRDTRIIDFSATGVGYDPEVSGTGAGGAETSHRIIRTATELISEECKIVEEASQVLVTTGSRSRDTAYLKTIERKLAAAPSLVYYRVLFGPPHNLQLKQHLEAVLTLRDPHDRTYLYQTVFLGLFDNVLLEPERFICANEKHALVALPSLISLGNFDTALLYEDPPDAQACVQLVKHLFVASKQLDSKSAVDKLEVLRGLGNPSGF